MPNRKFELPKELKRVESGDNYAKFVAEPFVTGYGHTVGNSLRRVLLSSIEGAAVAAVKIDGVQHEFQTVEGVHEDVTDIVLNLKRVLFKAAKRGPYKVTLDVDKEGPITAGDIQLVQGLDIVNKDQLICTLDKKRRFYAEIDVKVGHSWSTAEDNKDAEQTIGVIPVDSLYSPVRLAKYTVENTRVGQMTDYDKLILEVWTDGRITPDAALGEAGAILSRHIDIFVNPADKEAINNRIGAASKEDSEDQNKLRKLLNMSVNEIELSVRAANCLNNANITSVGELAMKSEPEMLKYRNFGKKSLTEIKLKLEQLGLSLGKPIDERLLDKTN
ncbi:MAG: DNA-directed RNA polymerase subunit alpha [Puniceicoccales bacterium]|jgi:DNA-directed RNA polymerase subunit alpha|nr:DNA-directed RNA polymerase subunit alpha [Puniceicoccales bacterium]